MHIGVEGGLSEWSGLRVSVRCPGESRSKHVTIGIDLRYICIGGNIFEMRMSNRFTWSQPRTRGGSEEDSVVDRGFFRVKFSIPTWPGTLSRQSSSSVSRMSRSSLSRIGGHRMAPCLSTINLGVGLRDGQLHSLELLLPVLLKSSKYFPN